MSRCYLEGRICFTCVFKKKHLDSVISCSNWLFEVLFKLHFILLYVLEYISDVPLPPRSIFTDKESWTHPCSLAMRCSSLSSLPLKPLAKGLFSIFSCVIWAENTKHVSRVIHLCVSPRTETHCRGSFGPPVRGPADVGPGPAAHSCVVWVGRSSRRPASWHRVNCLPKQFPASRRAGPKLSEVRSSELYSFQTSARDVMEGNLRQQQSMVQPADTTEITLITVGTLVPLHHWSCWVLLMVPLDYI